MRTISFLLLIVYVAGHTGLPLPLPGGACVAGACGCGDACQCAQEKVAAGNCCCRTTPHSDPEASGEPTSCCAAKAESCDEPETSSCCSKGAGSNECCDEQTCGPPVLLPCGCQQDAPEGIAVCSDPRLLPARTGPPARHCCGWHAPAGNLLVPTLLQAPDDPVPRLTA
jgi:hypothetical protein